MLRWIYLTKSLFKVLLKQHFKCSNDILVDSGYDAVVHADVNNNADVNVDVDLHVDIDLDDLSNNLLFQVTAVRQTSNTPQFHALSGNKQNITRIANAVQCHN